MGSTILLADKSITIQKIVELTFADEDFVIRCVNDGHTALEVIPQIRPDIILADIGLPGVSGYDLCTTLRTDSAFTDFKSIPLILLAGIYETMDEERAKQVEERVKNVGASDYLSKPFDSQLLTEKVKEFLARGVSKTEVDDTSPGAFLNVGAGTITETFMAPETKTEILKKDADLYPPPDDTEKTMIIEGPPAFSGAVFADKPPLEAPFFEDDSNSSTVKLSSSDVEAARAAYARVSRENSPSAPSEVESTMAMKLNPGDLVGSTEAMPGDEPFGNVFEESTARWRLSPLAEEENPFGLPEHEMPAPPPPPEPVVEEQHEEPIMSFEVERVESEFETASFHREEISEPSFIPDSTSMPEPVVENEAETASVEFPVSEPSSSSISNLDDTWPGTRTVSVQEESVQPESEEIVLLSDSVRLKMPPAMEEFDNKQPDYIEMADDTHPASSVATASHETTAASLAGTEIPEELIDRIVQKVIARLSESVVSDIVWQVVPDLAEKMIRRELQKIQAGEE